MAHKELIIRMAVLTYAMVNNILILNGINAIPYAEGQVEIVIAGAFTVGATLWSTWKNNSFTKEARVADKYMERLKKGSDKID